MKINSMLLLIGGSAAINRSFKIGDEVVDFDEEAAFVEEKAQLGLDDLMTQDDKSFEGFEKMLNSASKNSDKGELNIEMAKAQLTELEATLKVVDENILKEKDMVKKEKDIEKVNDFMAEVKATAAKVPKVKELWNKLGMSTDEGDSTFSKIPVDMESILKKSSSTEKGVKNALEVVKVKEN